MKGIKSFSSRELVHAIKENPQESRRDWLLDSFSKAAIESSNVKNHQFWRHDNKPIELWSNRVISQRIRYVHQSPVEEGLVFYPEDYLYSSALDYAGKKGILEDVIVVDI